MKFSMWRGLLAACLMFAATAALASPSNKWRLEFSGGAESAGQIVLLVTPEGGTPIEVTTDAKKSDGEDVLIKRRMGRPNVEVALVSNTVQAVRINFQHE